MSAPGIDARSRRPTKIPAEEYQHIDVARETKKLIDQGNWVQIGAHGQLQGLPRRPLSIGRDEAVGSGLFSRRQYQRVWQFQ